MSTFFSRAGKGLKKALTPTPFEIHLPISNPTDRLTAFAMVLQFAWSMFILYSGVRIANAGVTLFEEGFTAKVGSWFDIVGDVPPGVMLFGIAFSLFKISRISFLFGDSNNPSPDGPPAPAPQPQQGVVARTGQRVKRAMAPTPFKVRVPLQTPREWLVALAMGLQFTWSMFIVHSALNLVTCGVHMFEEGFTDNAGGWLGFTGEVPPGVMLFAIALTLFKFSRAGFQFGGEEPTAPPEPAEPVTQPSQ